jgi:hypothetical protein
VPRIHSLQRELFVEYKGIFRQRAEKFSFNKSNEEKRGTGTTLLTGTGTYKLGVETYLLATVPRMHSLQRELLVVCKGIFRQRAEKFSFNLVCSLTDIQCYKRFFAITCHP